MTVPDIATRTYNHNFRLDPIIRSLLDTDFYKLLMLQMIRNVHPDVRVTFGPRQELPDKMNLLRKREFAASAEAEVAIHRTSSFA